MFGGFESAHLAPPFNHPPLEIVGFSIPIHKNDELLMVEDPSLLDLNDAPLVDLKYAESIVMKRQSLAILKSNLMMMKEI